MNFQVVAVEKVKPKYFEELLSILTSVQDFDEDSSEHKEKIGPKLETLAGAWPAAKAFVGPKKQMLRLLKGWNMKIEFCINSKGPSANGNENTNGSANGTNNSQKKKKKKKHKTQERLREEKEMKMKMAKDQEDSDIPSFSTLVSDNINNEENAASDKLKRKVDSKEETPLKAKKKKKSSK